MTALLPIQTAPLFPVLHQKLIDLLRGLSPDEWRRETVCAGWSVKDIAAHLLDTSLRTITLYRDGYAPPDVPEIRSYQELVDYLNRLNNDWVQAMHRLSPAALTDWLDQAGREADALIRQLPPDEPAVFSVAWAGQTESPNWFHMAREYTERWHHQQQIRLAVGQTAELETDQLYQPLLDTFMRALPYAYRHVPAPTGTSVRFTVPGLASGNWLLVREADGWQLMPPEMNFLPAATIHIDRPYAWQLVTRNRPAALAATHMYSEGNAALGQPFLAMRAVMM